MTASNAARGAFLGLTTLPSAWFGECGVRNREASFKVETAWCGATDDLDCRPVILLSSLGKRFAKHPLVCALSLPRWQKH